MRRTDSSSAEIYDFLNKNKLDSLNILGFLANNDDCEAWVNDGEINCTVVRQRGSDMFFINAYSFESVKEAVRDIFSREKSIVFSGVRKEVADMLSQLADKTNEDLLYDDCYLYYYPEKSIDISDIPSNVGKIKSECAETLDYFYTYRSESSLEKIKHEIALRPTAATYLDGEIACWTLIHEDGSMGAMFTKPQFRNKKLAVNTSRFLISEVLKSGNIPFVHIVDINEPSIRLAKKIGLIFAYPVVWFEASFHEYTE